MENKTKKKNFIMTATAYVVDLIDKDYNQDAVLAMLSRGNYEEFSIPVKMYKKDLYGVEAEKDYGLTIGYVKKYDPKNNTFEFTVNEKNNSSLTKLSDTFIVIPKVSFTKDAAPRKILDLFLYPVFEDQ